MDRRVETEGIENLSAELKESVLKLKEYLDSRPLTKEAVFLALTGKEGIKQAEELLQSATELYQQAERLSLILERVEKEGNLLQVAEALKGLQDRLKDLEKRLSGLNVSVDCLTPDFSIEVRERGKLVEKPLTDLLRETYYAVNTLVYTDKDGKKHSFGELVDYLGNLTETVSYYLSTTETLLNEIYSELPKVKVLVYLAFGFQFLTLALVLYLALK